MAQEIYRNSAEEVRYVYLDVPVTPEGGQMEVTVYYNGEIVHDVPTVLVAPDGRYYFTMPFDLVQYDRQFDVRWEFEYTEGPNSYFYDNTTPVKVVTPLLTLDEIKAINSYMDD